MKIGIDLGGSHIAVGVVTDEGKVIAKKEENISFVEIDKAQIKGVIRDKILSLINHVTKQLQVPIFIIEQIGIGIPGVVENNLIVAIKKYGIYNWDLAKEIEEHYKIDVKISNDAVCSIRAEKEYGSLKGEKNAVFMCLGTGIGSAIIADNKIYESEIGHMVIQKDGNSCNCGRNGCFETYASMYKFKKDIIELLNLSQDTESEEILQILKSKKDNENINKYIDEYLNYLVIGISNIINILKPEVICIGGSFVHYEEIMFNKLIEKLKNSVIQYELPKIVLSSLKNDAGIIGAV